MRHTIVVLGFVAFLLAATPRHANAEIVTWEFTGTLELVHDFDAVFQDSVLKGDPFSGLVTFEASTTDSAL